MAKNDLTLYNFRFTDMNTGALIRLPTRNEMFDVRRFVEDSTIGESRELPDRYAQRVTGNPEATLEWDSKLNYEGRIYA